LGSRLKIGSDPDSSSDFIDYITPKTLTEVTYYVPDCDPGETPAYQIKASYSDPSGHLEGTLSDSTRSFYQNVRSRVKIECLDESLVSEEQKPKETEIQITFLQKSPYFSRTNENSKKNHDPDKELYWQLYQTSLKEYIFVHSASDKDGTGQFILMLMCLSSHEIFEATPENAATQILKIVERIQKTRSGLVWSFSQLRGAIQQAELLYEYALEKKYSLEKPEQKPAMPSVKNTTTGHRSPILVTDQDSSLPFKSHFNWTEIGKLFKQESRLLSAPVVVSPWQKTEEEMAKSSYAQKNRQRRIRRMRLGYAFFGNRPKEEQDGLDQSVTAVLREIGRLEDLTPSVIELREREVYEVVVQGHDFHKTKGQLDALKEKHATEVFLQETIKIAKKSFKKGRENERKTEPTCWLPGTNFLAIQGPRPPHYHPTRFLHNVVDARISHVVAIGCSLHGDHTAVDGLYESTDFTNYIAPENRDKDGNVVYPANQKSGPITVHYQPVEGAFKTYRLSCSAIDSAPVRSKATVKRKNETKEEKTPDDDFEIDITFLSLPDNQAFDLRSSPQRVREIFWEYHDISLQKLVLVHCRAGEGRTGNFILTQVLFSEIFSKKTVLSFDNPQKLAAKILQTLTRLRIAQPRLVSLENQFVMAIRNAVFLREYALQKKLLLNNHSDEEKDAKKEKEKEDAIAKMVEPLFAMSPPKNHKEILQRLADEIKTESKDLLFFDLMEWRDDKTRLLKERNPIWEWKTPLIDNAEHSLQEAALLAFVEQLKPLNLCQKNEKFIEFQNIFRPLLIHKNQCWDSFFGIKNTTSWRKAIDQIRKNALQQLKDEVKKIEQPVDKLRRLEDARRLPIFNEHRDNVTLMRTTNAVDEIDRLIKEARQEIAASSVTRSPSFNNR